MTTTDACRTTTPVLVAYDGSADAAAAIERAGALLPSGPAVVVNVWRSIADQADAGLVALPSAVVTSASEQLDRAAADESEELARNGASLARRAGFEPEPLSVRGGRSTPSELLRVADEQDAHLIALGSRGLSGVGSALLGSVSNAVAHRSVRPVLISPRAASATGAGGPIALCYDGSANAGAAIESVGALLAPRRAVVVSVWESAFSFALRRRIGDLTDVVEDLAAEVETSSAERARATAEQGAEIAASVGFDAEAVPTRAISKALEREHATVWRTILDVAAEQGADAIAVGSRGLSRTRSALLGSVSNGVLQHSQRPVFVVPSTASRNE